MGLLGREEIALLNRLGAAQAKSLVALPAETNPQAISGSFIAQPAASLQEIAPPFTELSAALVDDTPSPGAKSEADDFSPVEIDPSACTVYVADPKQRQAVAQMINSYAEGEFQFDANGYLQRSKPNPTRDNPAKSQYYSKRIDQAIASPKQLTVEINPNASFPDSSNPGGPPISIQDSRIGQGTTFADGNGQRVILSGLPNSTNFDQFKRPITLSPGEIVLHELLAHAIPRMVGGGTGFAAQNENKARRQINGMAQWPRSDREPE